VDLLENHAHTRCAVRLYDEALVFSPIPGTVLCESTNDFIAAIPAAMIGGFVSPTGNAPSLVLNASSIFAMLRCFQNG
jgi:hypothetical protein